MKDLNQRKYEISMAVFKQMYQKAPEIRLKIIFLAVIPVLIYNPVGSGPFRSS